MKTHILSGISKVFGMRLLLLILMGVFGSFFYASAQPVSNVKNSWLGNSYPDESWMPQGIEGMFVSPDGSVFTNVGWEEGGGQFTKVKDGNVTHGGGSHGYGRYGGFEVAANSTYVYFANEIGTEGGGLIGGDNWPPTANLSWTGVTRRNKSDIATGTSFSGAKGQAPFRYFLPMFETQEDILPPVTGLYATETELFAGFYNRDVVRVYDANTMAFKREWLVEKPRQMFIDKDGMLWIAVGNDATKIERYDINGIKQPEEINLPSQSFVGDFCIDNNNKMYIGDVGQREQVLIYTSITTTPALTSTFGILNGVYSGTPGKYENLKFNQVRGIGTDNSGNIYVCSTQWGTGGEGTILESYNLTTSTLNWKKYCVLFVDALGIDDSTDGKDVYGKCEHFEIDYSKPVGEEATLIGYTINKYKYPYDPRLHGELASVAVKNINGHKFLAMSSMNGGIDAIYRFNKETDGEVAIPCVVFGWQKDPLYPGSPDQLWVWRDLNANGQPEAGEYVNSEIHFISDGGYGVTVDNNGDVWVASGDKVKHMKCTGLNENNIPVYDGTFTSINKPVPFKSVRRVQYDVQLDRLYLGGTTTSYPSVHPWRAMGRAIHRYDNWSTGNRTAQSELVVPYETSTNTETVSFDFEKDYLFTIVDAASSTTFSRGQITVFNASTNKNVGYIRAPWAGIGYPDVLQCLDAYKRKSGEYVIIIEDDGQNKNIMYRWCPSGNCETGGGDVQSILLAPTSASIAEDSTLQLTISYNPINADNKNVKWTSDNESIATVNSSGFVTAVKPGTALIHATTEQGGKTFTTSITVTSELILGNEDSNKENKVNAYPNPVTGNRLFVSKVNGLVDIKITDILGKVFYIKTAFSSGILEIEDLNLKPGIYMVSVFSSEKKVFKIVVR